MPISMSRFPLSSVLVWKYFLLDYADENDGPLQIDLPNYFWSEIKIHTTLFITSAGNNPIWINPRVGTTDAGFEHLRQVIKTGSNLVLEHISSGGYPVVMNAPDQDRKGTITLVRQPEITSYVNIYTDFYTQSNTVSERRFEIAKIAVDADFIDNIVIGWDDPLTDLRLTVQGWALATDYSLIT